MKLDVILPAYNKDKIINNCYEKIKEEFKDIKVKFIFIDNCSNDNTLDIFKTIQKNDEENVKIISLSKHTEKCFSILAGLNYCNGDFVCVYDLDLNQNISYIKKMINFLKENNEYDSVCMCKKTKKDNKLKAIYRNAINNYMGYNKIKGNTYYRVFTRKMVSSIIELSKTNRINSYTFDNMGFKTNYEKLKSNEEILDKIIISKCIKPVIACLLLGIFCFLSSILLLLIKLITAKIDCETITIFTVLLLGGIILIFIGVISRNLILATFGKEPEYIIKEKIGFDEDML